jgi:hypothetical protein
LDEIDALYIRLTDISRGIKEGHIWGRTNKICLVCINLVWMFNLSDKCYWETSWALRE